MTFDFHDLSNDLEKVDRDSSVLGQKNEGERHPA